MYYRPPHILAALCLVFMCAMFPNAYGAITDSELWEKYKSRFVSQEGRVIDTGNNDISHSEGQSYGMLLAVHNNDEKSFKKIWQWTSRNLALRDDGLFAWKYIPNQAKPVEDESNSTDADLMIAWSMLRAGKRWNNKEYLDISRGLLRSIKANLIHEQAGYSLILPGPQWPIRKGTVVLNQSYWVYPALRDISKFDADPIWEKLIHSGIRMQQQARFGTWELPSDWIAMKPDGTFHQDDEFPFVFSYDAVRIPLYMIWGGFDQKDALRIYQAFWASTKAGSSRLVTAFGLSTNSIIQQENVLAYHAVNSLIGCAITGKPADVLDNMIQKYDDYYSATMFLITRMAASESMPSCLPGSIQYAGSGGKCSAETLSQCVLLDPIKEKSHQQEQNGPKKEFIKITDFTGPIGNLPSRPISRFVKVIADVNSGRVFLGTMNGVIREIKGRGEQGQIILDLGKELRDVLMNADPDMGMTAFALHPNFTVNGGLGQGLLYTAHSEKSVGKGSLKLLGKQFFESAHHDDVITEWRIVPGGKVVRRELMRIAQPFPSNNTTVLEFEPVGTIKSECNQLYIGVGDGGAEPAKPVADPYSVAQNLQSPLGKILRICPQSPANKRPYTVPSTNPFINRKNTLPEIWAYGFHHPTALSWLPDKMLILDRGSAGVQEVNIGQAGGNYGWSLRQGTFSINPANPGHVYPLPKKDTLSGLIYPVIQYDKDDGSAISNGLFYAGSEIPSLKNHFLFGDFDNGKLFSLPIDRIKSGVLQLPVEIKLTYNGLRRPMLQILNDDHRADLVVGLDQHGELLVLTGRDGMVRKLGPDKIIHGPAK